MELLELLVGNLLRWQIAEKDGSVRFKMGLGDIQPVQIPHYITIPSSGDCSVALFQHLGTLLTQQRVSEQWCVRRSLKLRMA